MLVDEMMDLLNKIDDVELVKYIIKMIDESNISNYRGIEEIIELGKVLKECEYNEYAYKIAIDPNILEKRTNEEQISLMKVLKECEYNKYAYLLAINFDFLYGSTFYARGTFKFYIPSYYHYIYRPSYHCKPSNEKWIGPKTTEEQIQLMLALKECEYNKYVYDIATNPNILCVRKTEDQIKLMRTLKECKYNKTAYDIACNIVILESKTTEEQIDLMKEKFKQCQPCERSMNDFDGELDKITSLEEKDVKKRILVPVYDDKKKNDDNKED